MGITDNDTKYRIERPIYSYGELTQDYNETKPQFSILTSLKSKARSPNKSVKSIVKSVIPFPFIMASFYSWKFLLSDLIAGFTMLIFHIPQGMAYGLLAGLQPINGLYASFIPPLTYFLFGTSRHLSIGTFSIMAILASGVTLREATLNMKTLSNKNLNSSVTNIISENPQFEIEKLHIAIAVTLLAGIIQLCMGFCKFGFLMNFISDSFIEGFTTAVTFHVIFSQLGKLLGYSIDRYSGVGELPYKLYLYGIKISEIHWMTFGISIGSIVILFLFTEFINPIFQRKFKLPFPTQFILVILATIISYYGNISTKYSVKIIGPIPKGLPTVLIPDLTIFPRIILDAFLLAIVGFVINSALVKTYSLRFSYKVNFNQELVAYGLSNILGSFFQCIISAGALSRSTVAVQSGMKSQLASIISCVFMLFLLLFIGPLFQTVPICVLSAVVIVSLKSMIMQFTNLPKLYRTSKYDFNVWIFTFLATILLNVPLGLAAGFLFSLLTIIFRLQNPKIEILGKLPNTNIYTDIKHFDNAKELPGIKIFRFEAPLYFANAESFKTKLYRKTNIISKNDKAEVSSSPTVAQDHLQDEGTAMSTNVTFSKNDTKLKIEAIEIIGRTKFLIIDFGSINYIDSVSIRVLNEISLALQKSGIAMLIAAPNTNTREMLKNSKFANEDLKDIMFVTVHDAVLRCLEKC